MQLFTEREAAEYLSRSPATLTRWRFERVGPAFVKLGRAVRYKLADLDAYVAAHRFDPEGSSTARANASA